jgi:hypothetical protein
MAELQLKIDRIGCFSIRLFERRQAKAFKDYAWATD